jgi:hypothetical protein
MNTFKKQHLTGARSLNICTHREIFAVYGVDAWDIRAEIVTTPVQVLV